MERHDAIERLGDPASEGELEQCSGECEYEFRWGSDALHQPRNGEEDDEEEDEEDEGVGLMEAFESFNLQAARRVKELLEATDAKLFAPASDVADPADAPPPNTPSYILMSDSFRLSRPPQFHHWRQCFPYLQITGKSSFDEVPDEHIQIRPGPPVSEWSPVDPSCSHGTDMVVAGRALRLEVDTSDPPQEELIVADGEMEEVLEENRVEAVDDTDSASGNGDDDWGGPPGSLSCASPRTSRAEEVVDQLVQDWFSELVPPVCVSVFEKLLRSRQLELRISREFHEEQVRLAHERAMAEEEAEQRRHEQKEQERLVFEATLAQAEEEERIREAERREELIRRQLEEHDEEEIKIRTLAYTHMREWYQPKKKCFSHRGRQLTYLKPVLKVQGQMDEANLPSVEYPAEAVDGDAAKPRPSVLHPRKPSISTVRDPIRRVSSPSEADIRNAQSPSGSPQTSPSSSQFRPSSEQNRIKSRPSVHLPRIDKPAANQASPQTKQQLKPPRKRSWREEQSPPAATTRVSATVAAPSRVYKISPYRIPPAILRADLKKDAATTGRRRRSNRSRRESQNDDRQGHSP